MGQKNFIKFLDSCNIDSTKYISELHLKDLDNLNIKIVCIDFSQIIHSCKSNIKKIIDYYQKLTDCNLKPIFVFDGKPPKEKKKILIKRKKDKENNIKKISDFKKQLEVVQSNEKLSDIQKLEKKKIINNDIKKLTKRIFSIKPKHIDEIKKVFNLLQIPYIHMENYEADLVCAALIKNKIADACISDDYDLMAYGCPFIIRKMYKKRATLINLNKLCEILSITNEQLRYLMIFNGCDFSRSLSNINISYLHTLMKRQKSVSEILKMVEQEDYNYLDAYNIFSELITINKETDIMFYDKLGCSLRNIDSLDKEKYFSNLILDDEMFTKDYKHFLSKYIDSINMAQPLF